MDELDLEGYLYGLLDTSDTTLASQFTQMTQTQTDTDFEGGTQEEGGSQALTQVSTQAATKVTRRKQSKRRVLAFGGQHRTAAALQLKSQFVHQIDIYKKQRDHIADRVAKGKVTDMEETHARDQQLAERIEMLEKRLSEQRWWKAVVFDIGKRLLMRTVEWSRVR